MDLNFTPNRETPKWGETRFFGCWNPDEGVGIYVHAGRFRKDLDMWWVQTVAYLPDGKLAVDRSWGRNPDGAYVRTGNFELAQKETGFSSTFDGVGELTTTDALAKAPRGASGPSVSFGWDVSFDPVSPVWDMYGRDTEKLDVVGDSHTQQGLRSSGTLSADGRTYSLDGVGWRDHSSGVRTWGGFGSHHFLLAVMPDYTVHTIMIFTPDGEAKGPLGSFYYRDGAEAAVERSEMPPMADARCGPDECELLVKPAGRDPMTLRIEIIAQCPITMNEDGDNLNGVDWEGRSDTLVFGEAVARVTQPDGTVGYAFHERSDRRDELPAP